MIYNHEQHRAIKRFLCLFLQYFLVIVGFSCFWMSVDAGGERITLTITTLLAVYAHITMVRVNILPTSYITGIHYREQNQRQGAIDEGEHKLSAMRKKNDITYGDSDPDADWVDEPSDPNFSRMYPAIKRKNNSFKHFQRREDQSRTEYYDYLSSS
ncbi:glycine receptor subunit alpha-4-like [Tropilaelaps mercedesae]|uniref:Glycine receptor subunit alpha-4-like n=1 Tax=Tropilaelaps mercedesae TaxID=418985 RepID=A0A1V9XZ07_9ACAR|nr:glycine receptor subunit alpha-4-like [Tropilaelaps mercedesae]